jgi:hypothetical protein
MLALIIQLVAGALGGLGTGTVLKDKSLGTAGNAIAGAIGGGLGGQLLEMMSAAPAATDAAATADPGMGVAGIIYALVAGGVGGGVLTAIAGYVKGMMAK